LMRRWPRLRFSPSWLRHAGFPYHLCLFVKIKVMNKAEQITK
jgi:hypothetical protein